MKKEKSEFYKVFQEIIRENGKHNPKTVAEEAELIGISAAQLSRIKSGNSSLTKRVIDLIAQTFGINEESKRLIRERLEFSKAQDVLKESEPTVKTALEEFHNRFFHTNRGEKRIICGAFFDIAQSTQKGRNPEYADASADVIRNGLSFACFQPFGPRENILKLVKKAVDAKNQELIAIWNYIYRLADSVHEGLEKTKESLKKEETLGQIVLYEAANVPSLTNCNLHSRLYYGERLSGDNKIQIVQLLLGKTGNSEYTEHYIECINESAFQSVVAEQFSPVLNYWRVTGKLPTIEEQIHKTLGKNTICPWKIYT
ncbi:MAG TPA: helix-turn-helix transcriptional regulator [Pyrinomonadaceae bacterium]